MEDRLREREERQRSWRERGREMEDRQSGRGDRGMEERQ